MACSKTTSDCMNNTFDGSNGSPQQEQSNTTVHTRAVDEVIRSNMYQPAKSRLMTRASTIHTKIPYVRHLPLPAILIILFLVFLNLLAWAICALILTQHHSLMGTAALAYSLGLRHALDADHISAIDLMTRRLIASGQRPVTVGTFFSLGHSTIVVVTSIVVAATAAGISDRFGGFRSIGGIIGTSVSAAFLILLGIMNAYILYKLVRQLWKVIHLQPEQEMDEGFKVEGGGVLFRILKRMFKLIDRPWKMYPLGVLFGLGFDTSSEVALLGISSIQGAKGTSIWLILIFPVLFTVGMCLIDTIDGALMMGLYVAPMGAMGNEIDKKSLLQDQRTRTGTDVEHVGSAAQSTSQTEQRRQDQRETQNLRVKSPLTFLYYSSVLTLLTVVVALVIGTIQLLSLILNVAVSDEEAERSTFWRGVSKASDNYDIIGGAICGAFVIFGSLSVALYRSFRNWVTEVRQRERYKTARGSVELVRFTSLDGHMCMPERESTGISRFVSSRQDDASKPVKGQSRVSRSVVGKDFCRTQP